MYSKIVYGDIQKAVRTLEGAYGIVKDKVENLVENVSGDGGNVGMKRHYSEYFHHVSFILYCLKIM